MNEGTETVVEKVEKRVEKSTPSVALKQKNKMPLVVGALVGVALVGVLVVKYFPGGTTTSTGSEKVSTLDPKSVVASVNGIEISRAELNKKIEQVKSTVPEGQPDPSADAAFELQLLDEVVNLKLLVSSAQAKGFTVSDEDIQKEITALVDRFGGEAEFQKQLTDNGLTPDDLRENMRNELLVRQLIDSETRIKDITVTDEEIKTTYDQAMAGSPEGQEVPKLAEVGEMIRAQLLQQKSAAVVQAYIDQLRTSAKIDILL